MLLMLLAAAALLLLLLLLPDLVPLLQAAVTLVEYLC
jgi:hypothetical protein